MPKVHQLPVFTPSSNPQSLRVGQQSMAIVNLRGNAKDPAFLDAVEQALGLALPVQACTTVANQRLRLVWVGPDDWFVFGPQGEQAALAEALRSALGQQHAAVTDVSSGYFVVSLAGPTARDLLAQGCPMDFHPNAFHVDQAATTHFHKVGITVWKSGDASRFELLVRRSFIDHFWQLVVAGSREFGITQTVAA
jgi:sarcosine oxidase subunit gamma